MLTDANTLVSDCHSYPVAHDGRCMWCSDNAGVHLVGKDPLLKKIEARLCDWNAPRKLESYDLWSNIYKVAVLVKEGVPDEVA